MTINELLKQNRKTNWIRHQEIADSTGLSRVNTTRIVEGVIKAKDKTLRLVTAYITTRLLTGSKKASLFFVTPEQLERMPEAVANELLNQKVYQGGR